MDELDFYGRIINAYTVNHKLAKPNIEYTVGDMSIGSTGYVVPSNIKITEGGMWVRLDAVLYPTGHGSARIMIRRISVEEFEIVFTHPTGD